MESIFTLLIKVLFFIEPNGIIGYHQAVVLQLLLIGIWGHVKTGDAVFCKKEEWHELSSSEGITAIDIESEMLNPNSLMTRL
ncbi:hypothetical protein [Bacillus sp. UMB0893]|uniref:hypothetical protein n=1 Tax=Bacillus sp. UMB0893 TaxID=2066053 RepID=UPI000C761114|nr:hypothetical protein [Bacillus sp. UMB0893]PLR69076.1 hypothetical protein CYJ36_01020 [Bacillus sp. UMB0893]